MTWEGGEREGREEEKGLWVPCTPPPKLAERSQTHYVGDSLGDVPMGVLPFRDRHQQGEEEVLISLALSYPWGSSELCPSARAPVPGQLQPHLLSTLKATAREQASSTLAQSLGGPRHQTPSREKTVSHIKGPRGAGLSLFPRVDICHVDETFFWCLTSQLLLCSAAWLGVGLCTPPRGFVFLELLPLWAQMRELGWPHWPLGTIFGVLGSQEAGQTQPETDGWWAVPASWRCLAPQRSPLFLQKGAQPRTHVSLLGLTAGSFLQRDPLCEAVRAALVFWDKGSCLLPRSAVFVAFYGQEEC